MFTAEAHGIHRFVQNNHPGRGVEATTKSVFGETLAKVGWVNRHKGPPRSRLLLEGIATGTRMPLWHMLEHWRASGERHERERGARGTDPSGDVSGADDPFSSLTWSSRFQQRRTITERTTASGHRSAANPAPQNRSSQRRPLTGQPFDDAEQQRTRRLAGNGSEDFEPLLSQSQLIRMTPEGSTSKRQRLDCRFRPQERFFH